MQKITARAGVRHSESDRGKTKWAEHKMQEMSYGGRICIQTETEMTRDLTKTQVAASGSGWVVDYDDGGGCLCALSPSEETTNQLSEAVISPTPQLLLLLLLQPL